MQTHVNCPQCGTPYTAEIHQVIDSDETPELKHMLLNGRLNVATCPSCGASGQMMTPMLFHDATYEMFAVFMPPEMNLAHEQREQIIGQLARQVMDSLPPEKRRAYMLQPQTIISMQTFMEKVLETEGITKEMIARQQNQLELLQKLAAADSDVADYLIKERIGEIDETFFAMLQQYIDGAAQAQDDKQIVALTNLRAKLMTGTEIGRQIEKQQIALHGLNREAKAQEGLSPELLLKHLLKHAGDEGIESALVMAGQPALTYQFFNLLTAEIEKQEKAKDLAAAQKLTEMRSRLLKVYDEMQAQSQKMLADAEETLQAIMAADDKDVAIQANAAKINDAFMYVLSSRIAQADQQGKTAEAQALNEVYERITKQAESQYPPEIMLLNQLMEAENEAAQQQVLDENAALLTPELIQVLDAVMKQFEDAGQGEMNGRLNAIKGLVEARI